jgi:hypothetical protein
MVVNLDWFALNLAPAAADAGAIDAVLRGAALLALVAALVLLALGRGRAPWAADRARVPAASEVGVD